MKKTIITLLALAGAAGAAISVNTNDITVSGESALTIDSAFLTTQLGANATNWTDIDNNCKVGSFFFNDYQSTDTLSLTFGITFGVYQMNMTHPGTLNLTFNNGATVHTSSGNSYTSKVNETNHINYGTSSPDVTVTVNLTDAQIETLIQEHSLSYQLIDTASAWNYENLGSLVLSNVSTLSGMNFTNKGIITDASSLQDFEYGLINTKKGLTLVAKAPEPATATLSLLALAGLAARRRR